MPVNPTYPGVYIQEVPSGTRTISGVATSIAMFVGRTEDGIINKPKRVLNYTEFKDEFGTGTQQSEMAHQVRQFFQNGGGQAYVMRIAEGPKSASVVLTNEAGQPVLNAIAKEAGKAGERIRIEVDYHGLAEPEKNFNMRVFRFVENGAGGFSEEEPERFSNLSMDGDHPRYAPEVVSQGSALINLEKSSSSSAPSPQPGFVVAGRVLEGVPPGDSDINFDQLKNIVEDSGGNYKKTRLRISIGGDFQEIDLENPLDRTSKPPFSKEGFSEALNNALGLDPSSDPLNVSFVPFGSGNSLLVIKNYKNEKDIAIEPLDTDDDLGSAMQFGTDQGGIEIGAYASHRPAPSAVFFQYGGTGADPTKEGYWKYLADFANKNQKNVEKLVLDNETVALDLVTTSKTNNMLQGNAAPESALANVKEKFQQLVMQFNGQAPGIMDFNWTAELQGLRLVFKPTSGDANAGRGVLVTTSPFDDALATDNTRYYSIGPGGSGGFQRAGKRGDPGSKPTLATYNAAFRIIRSEVGLFNLLVLPRDADGKNDRESNGVWAAASIFAKEQRAFLLVDPPLVWNSDDAVTRSADPTIGKLRRGLATEYAGVYWPRLKIIDPDTGLEVFIDPSGTLAGVAARIDSSRGVWKAFAGIEANLLSVRAVEYPMSDMENGVINQQAVNAVRVFPNGVLSWGARTMAGFDGSGEIDYRYIPVRRLALFIEESLYRGLRWAVFEPNDPGLWAQIRLAVGGFMQNLFQQGAFQGTTPKNAYFVKVDSETTTQRDINLGIVNILVGFAPVRPAEFVILRLQQIAGQGQ